MFICSIRELLYFKCQVQDNFLKISNLNLPPRMRQEFKSKGVEAEAEEGEERLLPGNNLTRLIVAEVAV